MENICCSISCLYVAKCQFTEDLDDISKSLFYADNNVEAYMLKAMISLKKGNEKISLNLLDRVLEIDPANKIVKQIHNTVYKQLFPYHDLEEYTEK